MKVIWTIRNLLQVQKDHHTHCLMMFAASDTSIRVNSGSHAVITAHGLDTKLHYRVQETQYRSTEEVDRSICRPLAEQEVPDYYVDE